MYSKLKHKKDIFNSQRKLNKYLIPPKKRTVPITFLKCLYPLLETV